MLGISTATGRRGASGAIVYRWWGALLAALVLSAGCNGGSGSGPTQSVESSAGVSSASGSASASVSPQPSYPNAGPGELPPVRPIDVLTDQGAEAFARYFMQTVDWAYATMDSSLMRTAYDPATCNYCNQAANRTDADRVAGKRYEGGRSTIIDVIGQGSDEASNLVIVVFNAAPVRVYDSSGTLVSDSAAELSLQFNVRVLFKEHWTVTQVQQVLAQ